MKPDLMIPAIQEQFPDIVHLEIAETFWKRAIGLAGRQGLDIGQGLLIPSCGAIHTFFMRFPIDVIFLDHGNRVVKVINGLKPWRLAWGGRNAYSTLEVRSGWLSRQTSPKKYFHQTK